MDYSMNSAGVCTACIREYEINTQTDVKKGTVVGLSNGKAIAYDGTGKVLGITAMDYYCKKDELKPGSGNGRVKVIVSPGLICRMEHISFTVASQGTATSVEISGISTPSTNGAFAGGYIRLVSKTQSSQNSDNVGDVRQIIASSGDILTVENGGIACAGDVYEILLPAGFEYLSLDEACRFVIGSEKSNIARVAVCLPTSAYAEVMFTDTFFN